MIYKSFEEYWTAVWPANNLPPAMNEAFKEVAEKAWKALAASQTELVETLAEADRLYSTYGLVAGSMECGPWINKVRTILDSRRKS